MLIIKNTLGSKGHDTIIAEVPFVKAPKITKVKTIVGVKYYFGEGGKVYIAICTINILRQRKQRLKEDILKAI